MTFPKPAEPTDVGSVERVYQPPLWPGGYDLSDQPGQRAEIKLPKYNKPVLARYTPDSPYYADGPNYAHLTYTEATHGNVPVGIDVANQDGDLVGSGSPTEAELPLPAGNTTTRFKVRAVAFAGEFIGDWSELSDPLEA